MLTNLHLHGVQMVTVENFPLKYFGLECYSFWEMSRTVTFDRGTELNIAPTVLLPFAFILLQILHTIFQDISDKTMELINNLKSLSDSGTDGAGKVSIEALRERKMPPATESFLFNLATAEGLAQV